MRHTTEHAERDTDIHEHLVMLYRLVVESRARTVVELGVRGGESTVALLEGVHAADGQMISVDIEPCLAARKMVEDYGLAARWTFVQGDDLDFGIKWDRMRPIDMVFVDTSHLAEHTRREIELYEPLVRPGGILAFHDTVSFPDGVLRPIQEFLASHRDHRFRNMDNNNGLGVMTKPG